MQTADGKTAAPGISVKVDATGDAHNASQVAETPEDTEKENEHRVRPGLKPIAHSMLPWHALLSRMHASCGLAALLSAANVGKL